MNSKSRCTATAATLVLLIIAQGRAGQGGRPFELARQQMVDSEIVAAGVQAPRVIEAMRTVPRHEFVPVAQRKFAYLDMALPIGEGQTISPPFVVAYMTEQLDSQPSDRVLEIGTGSGYQAAVLSGLVKDVYTIEIVESLGRRAASTLRKLGYKNVHTRVGDGFAGWSEAAPFDKVIVTCSPESVPPALVEQLREGGTLIIPLGERFQQSLYRFKKQDGRLVREALLPTLFVPMTGQAEDQRRVQPDALNPKIENGGFEQVVGDSDSPVGWHYQRQVHRIAAADAPVDTAYVTFHNSVPGRGSQALQGFAIDGRAIRQIELSTWVRAKRIEPASAREAPIVAITFYDDQRATVADVALGPWRGTFDWKRESRSIRVPTSSREAVLRLGLFGATGEISFDEVALEVTTRE